jgi:peptidoglycan/LPS O-acetylase OafA/YrhL
MPEHIEPVGGESRRSTGDHRLPSLTGMRFFAAFVVFGFHVSVAALFLHTDGAPGVLNYVFRQGATGVSFFFLLSGFVLCWSARPGDTAPRFWRRRAAKIYPNHLVTAVAAVGVVAAAGTAVTFGGTILNFLLLQAWVPRPGIYFGLNTPSWSLSCEMFFYLCFPLILRAVDRLPVRRLWPATIATLAAVCVMPAVALLLPGGLRYWFVYVFPPVRLLEFVVGILLARIVRNGRWIRLGVRPATLLVVAAYFGSGYLPLGFSYIAGTVVPLALLIPAVAARDLRGEHSFLRTRTAIWLGEVSFAFYLVHQLVIRAVGHVSGPTGSDAKGFAVILVMLAVTMAASWGLFRFVETPMMARLAGRRPRPVPDVVPQPEVAPGVS